MSTRSSVFVNLKVRGPNYLKNKVKIKASPAAFHLVAYDLYSFKSAKVLRQSCFIEPRHDKERNAPFFEFYSLKFPRIGWIWVLVRDPFVLNLRIRFVHIEFSHLHSYLYLHSYVDVIDWYCCNSFWGLAWWDRETFHLCNQFNSSLGN